jgi:hypothetical protein
MERQITILEEQHSVMSVSNTLAWHGIVLQAAKQIEEDGNYSFYLTSHNFKPLLTVYEI